jgi:hypothetical protein
MIFKIGLKRSHVFIGIKSGDSIEILQAWLGEYTIREWLSEHRNCFTKGDFIKLLQQISTNKDVAKRFFSTAAGQISLPDKIEIERFDYKTFRSKEDLLEYIDSRTMDNQKTADICIYRDINTLKVH